MTNLMGALGINAGTADSNSKSDTTGSSTTSNANSGTASSTGTTSGTSTNQGSTNATYSGDQGGMQGSLASALEGLISNGGNSPQLQAQQTASADQINKNYANSGTAMNRFLAARGFGSSGKAGNNALQTELGRQSALAQNSASYGATALSNLNTSLSQALQFAFANPGTMSSGTTSNTGTNTEGVSTNSTGTSSTNSNQSTTASGTGSSVGVGVGVGGK
jgi:hypothetical protein